MRPCALGLRFILIAISSKGLTSRAPHSHVDALTPTQRHSAMTWKQTKPNQTTSRLTAYQQTPPSVAARCWPFPAKCRQLNWRFGPFDGTEAICGVAIATPPMIFDITSRTFIYIFLWSNSRLSFSTGTRQANNTTKTNNNNNVKLIKCNEAQSEWETSPLAPDHPHTSGKPNQLTLYKNKKQETVWETEMEETLFTPIMLWFS